MPGSPDAASPFTGELQLGKMWGVGLQRCLRLRLKLRGIVYAHQLLAAASTPAKRHRLAAVTGIDEATLRELAKRADLARIRGVGSAVFAAMLQRLGVDTVAALARQRPARLHARLRRLNAAEGLARRAPTPAEVEDWVVQARALPRVLVEDRCGHRARRGPPATGAAPPAAAEPPPSEVKAAPREGPAATKPNPAMPDRGGTDARLRPRDAARVPVTEQLKWPR